MKPQPPSPTRAAALLIPVFPLSAAAQTFRDGHADSSQSPPPARQPDIPALIQQLGASYVRPRCEAETALKDPSDAMAPLGAHIQSSPVSEAGLRAVILLPRAPDPQSSAVVLNAGTHAVEWAASFTDQGFHSTVWINQDHFASSFNDGHVPLWSRRVAPILLKAE